MPAAQFLVAVHCLGLMYLTFSLNSSQAILKKVKTETIRDIINWTMSHIQEHVINWIKEQGGWVRLPHTVSFLNL